MINHAIILAAGRGVRMMPRTRKIPKAMVKIKNQTLSLKRAKAVNNILVSAGINPTRLSYLGAGVDRSVTKDARQFARRVTFKIN